MGKSKKLKVNVSVDGTFYGPDHKQPPADVAKEITNPDVWDDGDDDDGDDVGSNEPKALDDMNAKELKAEIDRRNEGRDDDAKLSKSGKNADLLAALKADDVITG